MPYIVENQYPMSPIRRIRTEAERRIDRGILVNGRPFRADDASTQRVGEFLHGFRDGLVEARGIEFRTADGTAIMLKSADDVERIYNAQRRHRTACLAISAALQSSPPPDPGDDRHWPSPETITI